MKKLLLSVATVGALAFGGTASAQDAFGLGSVLPQILNNIGLGNGNVAGAVQGGQVYTDQWGRRIYVDPHGRQSVLNSDGSTVDQYGRRVWIDGRIAGQAPNLMGGGQPTVHDQYGRPFALGQYGTNQDIYGRTVYLGPDGNPAYVVESNGSVTRYSAHNQGGNIGSRSDRDGDGVANLHDRYPSDPRYR